MLTVDGTSVDSYVSNVVTEFDGIVMSMNAASVAKPSGQTYVKLGVRRNSGISPTTMGEHSFTIIGL